MARPRPGRADGGRAAGQGLADEAAFAAVREDAERFAASLRERMNADAELTPADLFDHVYAEPTPQLREQAAQLRAELDAEAASHGEDLR